MFRRGFVASLLGLIGLGSAAGSRSRTESSHDFNVYEYPTGSGSQSVRPRFIKLKPFPHATDPFFPSTVLASSIRDSTSAIFVNVDEIACVAIHTSKGEEMICMLFSDRRVDLAPVAGNEHFIDYLEGRTLSPA